MASLEDLAGCTFGRLTAESYDRKSKRWICSCSCGNYHLAMSRNLRLGLTRSCGCLRREQMAAVGKQNWRHGDSNSAEWHIWKGMLDRCYRQKNVSYKNYGGRGITVCSRWRESYENFIEDMGRRPSKWHSLDRKDNALGYSKDNCVWATQEEQHSNKRTNCLLTFQGKTMTAARWARELGVRHSLISARVKKGWPIEEILSPPRVYTRAILG